jgi:hypothetical protein
VKLDPKSMGQGLRVMGNKSEIGKEMIQLFDSGILG